MPKQRTSPDKRKPISYRQQSESMAKQFKNDDTTNFGKQIAERKIR